MIFAVDKEVNVVTFKTKVMILMMKLSRMRAGIYMLFSLVGWKKFLFLGKKTGKGSFYQKEAGILYLSPLDTNPCNIS